MMQFLAEFLGHFHPVIVHLPIGILILAAVFYALARTRKYQTLRPAVGVSLLFGMLGAVVACITGWLLSNTGDYDPDVVASHQWFAIATAIVSAICYLMERRNFQHLPWAIVFLFLMITITGHLGGTLTHGDDYLTQAFDNYSGSGETITAIDNVQDALVYDDVVRPILSTKCYSCHGKRKQKGGLRLDDKESILKGGKNGVVIVAGDAGRSELVQRIFLAHENEDHMPPKEKPQPTSAQKDLIKWWIASGASFDKKIRDLKQAPDIQSTLASLGSGGEAKSAESVPAQPVDEAPPGVLSSLARRGVVVVPVAQNSHYLSVNFVNASTSGDSIMILLKSIDRQVVWLKTGSYPVDSEELKSIGKLKRLTRLQISNLIKSGNELAHLSGLKNLQFLNLAGADLTDENVNALKNITSLQHLYLFQCGISPTEYAALSKSLPGARIDTGAYVVPTLASDTTEVTTGRP